MKKATLVITIIAVATSVAYITSANKPMNKQAVKAIQPLSLSLVRC